MAHADLTRAGFSGHYGFAIVEPSRHEGAYDQEICIAVHQWEPALGTMGPPDNGWEIMYRSATFNGKMLGAGDPLRVREGQRVLFRLLNASATDEIRLALPGHQFRVIAMDGNPVPRPQTVDFLYLDIGERIDALVEMKNPGVWVFGAVSDEFRNMGMGVVVEYANKAGQPQWQAPANVGRGPWDYAQFSNSPPAPEPDHTFEMLIQKIPGNKKDFNHWTINGKSFPDIEKLRLEKGKRYRLSFNNDSGDTHPLHLHRHLFEITQVGDQRMSGLKKDVISVARRSRAAVDFVATIQARLSSTAICNCTWISVSCSSWNTRSFTDPYPAVCPYGNISYKRRSSRMRCPAAPRLSPGSHHTPDCAGDLPGHP
jgi:FtsP/CotA-like multicopper oxidase with cupredoxin domain